MPSTGWGESWVWSPVASNQPLQTDNPRSANHGLPEVAQKREPIPWPSTAAGRGPFASIPKRSGCGELPTWPSGFRIKPRRRTGGQSGTKWIGTARVISGCRNSGKAKGRWECPAARIARFPRASRGGARRTQSHTPRADTWSYPREECRSDWLSVVHPSPQPAAFVFEPRSGRVAQPAHGPGASWIHAADHDEALYTPDHGHEARDVGAADASRKAIDLKSSAPLDV